MARCRETNSRMYKSLQYLLFGLCLLGTLALSAQNKLLVKRTKGKTRYLYEAGQYISLRTVDGKKIRGPINAIKADYLIIDFTEKLPLDSIETIYAQGGLLKSLSTYVLAVSTLYLGLDMLNNSFNTQHNGWKTAAVSGGIAATAAFISKKRMSNKKGKWHFEILIP